MGFIAETIEAARKEMKARKPELTRELKRVTKEVGKLDKKRENLVAAVEKGNASTSVGKRLREIDHQDCTVARPYLPRRAVGR